MIVGSHFFVVWFRLTNYFIHADIEWLSRYLLHALKGEAEADFVGLRQTGQQTVIVPFAASQPVALAVERHTRHYDAFYLLKLQEKYTQ